jgi:hypothetical protein
MRDSPDALRRDRDYPELLGYEIMVRRIPVYGSNWPKMVAATNTTHPFVHTRTAYAAAYTYGLRTHHHPHP